MATSITVISGHPDLEGLNEHLPEGLVAIVTPANGEPTAEQVVDHLVDTDAALAVLGPELDDRLVMETGAALRSSRPEIACVAYRAFDSGFLTRAIRSGVRDVVDPDHDGITGLAGVLAALAEEGDLRRNQLLTEEPKRELGTITVLGPKGGVGKTTVAVNLAVALARQYPNEVVLVDLDLVVGEVADLLQLEPTQTVATTSAHGAGQDPAALKLALTPHPSGLLVLPAPTSLAEAETVDAEGLLQTLQFLSSLFRHVVVDTGPGSTDAAVSAVLAATDLVVVTTPDIGGLRALERHLAAFQAAGVQPSRRHLVLNRADDKSGVAATDVSEALGADVSVTIPESRQVILAANQGVPFVEAVSRGPVASSFETLARIVSGDSIGETPAAKRWFW